MAWTPVGTKLQKNTAVLAINVEADVPAGAALIAVIGAAGHAEWPITASVAGNDLAGGPTGFFASANEDQRVFGIDCADGLAAGSVVTVDMTDAGQGFTTTMWGTLFFVPDTTVADLGVFV